MRILIPLSIGIKTPSIGWLNRSKTHHVTQSCASLSNLSSRNPVAPATCGNGDEFKLHSTNPPGWTQDNRADWHSTRIQSTPIQPHGWQLVLKEQVIRLEAKRPQVLLKVGMANELMNGFADLVCAISRVGFTRLTWLLLFLMLFLMLMSWNQSKLNI